MSKSKLHEMEYTCYIRQTEMRSIVNCSTCIYSDGRCQDYQFNNGYKPSEGYIINSSRKFGRGITLNNNRKGD